MNTKMFRLLGVGLAAALLAGCAAATENKPAAQTPTPVAAPTTLFKDAAITTYLSTGTAAGQKGMIQDQGNSSATNTIDVSAVPAVGTFKAYPAYWDGGIGWLMKPTGSTGYFDLSTVKTIKFKIKSATILPSELAFFIQWKSTTAGAGGEYTLALNTLGATDLTAWNEVSVDLTQGTGKIPDEITAARYNHAIEKFFTGTGNTNVDTPIAIKWYGSAGASPNSGSLTADESYQIGDIQFLKADGTAANIASGITWPTIVPATTPAYLYRTSGTADLTTGTDNWGTGTTITMDYSGDATYNPAVQLVGAGGSWGTVLALTGLPAGTIAKYKTIDFKIKTSDFTDIKVKVPEVEKIYALSTGTALTGGWVQMSIPVSDFDTAPTTAVQFAIFGGSSTGTILLTDITLAP